MDEDVTIEDIYVYSETTDSWLIGFDDEEPDDDNEKFWIPKSKVRDRDFDGVGDSGFIVIPERLAKDKGIDDMVS